MRFIERSSIASAFVFSIVESATVLVAVDVLVAIEELEEDVEPKRGLVELGGVESVPAIAEDSIKRTFLN